LRTGAGRGRAAKKGRGRQRAAKGNGIGDLGVTKKSACRIGGERREGKVQGKKHRPIGDRAHILGESPPERLKKGTMNCPEDCAAKKTKLTTLKVRREKRASLEGENKKKGKKEKSSQEEGESNREKTTGEYTRYLEEGIIGDMVPFGESD